MPRLIHVDDFDKARFMICLFSKTPGWAFLKSEEGENTEQRRVRIKTRLERDGQGASGDIFSQVDEQLSYPTKKYICSNGLEREEVCVCVCYMLTSFLSSNSESADVLVILNIFVLQSLM